MSEIDVMIEDINLWQTQMFALNYPDHEAIKSDLLKAIYANQEQQTVAVESEVAIDAKHGLYESKLDFLTQPIPAVRNLREFVEEMLGTVATAVNQEFWPPGSIGKAQITESWYHITQNGGYHDAHSHPNCSWCGIYYVDAGDCEIVTRNGSNRFYDPRFCADQYLDAGTAYINSNGFWDFQPTEGQMVIFPSYLKHSALPYFGQQDRVIVAFNSIITLD